MRDVLLDDGLIAYEFTQHGRYQGFADLYVCEDAAKVIEVDGTESAIAGRGVCIAPRIENMPLSYVLEYDCFFAMSDDVTPTFSKNPGATIARRNTWVRMRREVILRERAGRREEEVTFFVNGKRKRQLTQPYDAQRGVQIHCRELMFRTDNVTIRELLPSPGNPGGE